MVASPSVIGSSCILLLCHPPDKDGPKRSMNIKKVCCLYKVGGYIYIYIFIFFFFFFWCNAFGVGDHAYLRVRLGLFFL